MDTHRVDFTMAPVTFTDSSCTGPGWPGLSLGLLGRLGCLAALGANGLAAAPCSKDYLHVKDDPNNLRYGIYNRWIVFLWSRPCRRHSLRTLLFKIPFESNCLSITACQPASARFLHSYTALRRGKKNPLILYDNIIEIQCEAAPGISKCPATC